MHRRSAAILGWCCLALIVSNTPACPAAEPVPANELVSLVQELGSDNFTRREAATRSLDRMGDNAIDALRQGLGAKDPEIRRRAELILTRIESRGVTARLLESQRVRLSLKDVTVEQAVAAFARQTSYPIQFQANAKKAPDRKVTIEIKEAAFWDSFDQFCQRAGVAEMSRLVSSHIQPKANALTPQQREEQAVRLLLQRELILSQRDTPPRPSANHLALTEGKAPALPTFIKGAARIQALPPALWPKPPEEKIGQAEVLLEVDVEPRIDWKRQVGIQIDHALDEHGHVLEWIREPIAAGNPSDIEDLQMLVIVNGRVIGHDPENPPHPTGQSLLRFHANHGTPRIIRELKGYVSGLVQTPVEKLVGIENALGKLGQSIRGSFGVDFTVAEAKADDDQIFIRLEIQNLNPPDGPIPFNPRFRRGRFRGRINEFYSSAHDLKFTAADAKGRELTLAQSELRFSPRAERIATEYLLVFQVDRDHPGPYRLDVHGKQLVVVDVPFVLKNVPVP